MIEWSTSHPSYFNDGALCDLLVSVKACSTLEEGDGFPQVSLRHPHQRFYTLNERKQSSLHRVLKKAAAVLCLTCKSPPGLFLTSLVYLRFSFSQMSSKRSFWIWLARGLKRNLEHLEVRGSIILENKQHGQDQSHRECVRVLQSVIGQLTCWCSCRWGRIWWYGTPSPLSVWEQPVPVPSWSLPHPGWWS